MAIDPAPNEISHFLRGSCRDGAAAGIYFLSARCLLHFSALTQPFPVSASTPTVAC